MKHRISHLDGLRGIAAMLVVVGHILEETVARTRDVGLANAWHAIDLNWFNLGRVGVVAFFCVSGFVIPFSFKDDRPLVTFCVSRFFRLYPAYWLSLGLAVLVLPTTPGLAQVLANATMGQSALGQADVVPVYWTLFLELLFYGLCFVAMAAGVLHNARYLMGAMVALVAAAVAGALFRWTHAGSNIPVGLPLFLAVMHFGTLTRLRLLERDVEAERLFPWALGLLVLVAPAINFLAYSQGPERPAWSASLIGFYLGVGLFLACVTRRWFGSRSFVWLGGISYSLYLFHPVVLFVTRELPVWANLLALPASVLVAWLANRFAEKPAQGLGRWVSDLLTGPRLLQRPVGG